MNLVKEKQPIKIRNVVITGANRGIGFELTKEILDKYKPDNLFATYRNPDNSKELLALAEENVNLNLLQLDVGDYSKYRDLIHEIDTVTNGTGVNLFINNSGILEKPAKNSIMNIDRSALVNHLETNTIAPVLLTQAFIPLLEKAGVCMSNLPLGVRRAAVVNISTIMASITDTNDVMYFAYRVSKCALNMATKCISLELKMKNIVILAIHPGWVKTDMGGMEADLTVEQSASHILKTLESVDGSQNGHFLNYDGKELPW